MFMENWSWPYVWLKPVSFLGTRHPAWGSSQRHPVLRTLTPCLQSSSLGPQVPIKWEHPKEKQFLRKLVCGKSKWCYVKTARHLGKSTDPGSSSSRFASRIVPLN